MFKDYLPRWTCRQPDTEVLQALSWPVDSNVFPHAMDALPCACRARQDGPTTMYVEITPGFQTSNNFYKA